MSSLAFVTHPSVRIKGTENVYNPTPCMDERCPVKAPHLHCPLCVKTDAYQDPVILKAHYRVKHVDKGIDFAGLKILRCCDQCDIIGIIKGEKRFKGAHWHCYRCRNGFNRRDEAIKHYKTHFRNPQTTFQIQITQDLNSPPEIRSHEDHSMAMQESFGPGHNSMETIMRTPISQQAVHIGETNVLKTVANSIQRGQPIQKVKHEPLEKDGEPEEETIMIIQGTQLETALASHIIDTGDLGQLGKTSIDPDLSWEIRFRMEEEEKNMYKAKAEDYKMQVDLLKQQVSDLEAQLAQQRQLCFHDLMAVFASDNLAQKQTASEQLTKLLEQCQAFLPGARRNLTDSMQSDTDADSDSQQQGHVSKAQTISGLMDDFGHGHEGCTGGLVLAGGEHDQKQLSADSIAEEFHVICTSAEGQGIMASTLDASSASVKQEQDLDLDTPVQTHSEGEQPEQAAMFAQILGQAEQPGMAVHAVLPEISEGGDQSEEPGSECLMEAVAANGLASLGQDVMNAADRDGHSQSQGPFMVTLEDGQGIIIQQEPANVEEGDHLQFKDEQSSKRFKVS